MKSHATAASIVLLVVTSAWAASPIALHEERGGLAVYLGESADVVSAFRTRGNYSLYVLSRDKAFVAALRKRIKSEGWYGRGSAEYGNAAEGGYAWCQSLKRVIHGKVLCADRDAVYGYGRKPKYRRWTVPLEFELFSMPKTPKTATPNQPRRKKPAVPPAQPNWSVSVPIWVRAMLVTEDALLVCGPRDLYDEDRAVGRGSQFTTQDPRLALQQEHAEGKHGSLLKVFDKKTGRETCSIEIDDMPTWDGMIAAQGRIFMTTVNGKILCFDAR